IQALGGSVQIANLAGNTLRVNNALGRIAAQDEIGFQTLGSTSQSKAMLSVMGGTLSADDVSFVSPDGRIRAEVDRIDGSVNVSGGMADIGVAAGNLDLATMNLTGDPIIYNSGGDVNLALNSGTNPTGGDYVVLAKGNITATISGGSSATVDATSATGTGSGAITLAAGSTFTINGSEPAPRQTTNNCTACA